MFLGVAVDVGEQLLEATVALIRSRAGATGRTESLRPENVQESPSIGGLRCARRVIGGDLGAHVLASRCCPKTAELLLRCRRWQDAIAQTIRVEPLPDQKDQLDRVARTVHAAYRIRQRVRLAIVRGIAERIVPLT